MRNQALEWCTAVAFVIGSTNPGRAEAQAAHESPLPAPSGPYSVGRTQFDWTDTTRVDAENPSGHREIVVWAWYPATPQPGVDRAEWMPGKWGELFSSDFVSGHPNVADAARAHSINGISSHAYADAPAMSSPQRFPVVLFAPGLGTTPLEYAGIIEDVASHGYIVAGIVPTYFARVSVFSDGRTIAGREILAATGYRGSARPTTREALRAFEQAASILSHDMIFTLNQLRDVDADPRSPLRGRFDFGRVGALGHSLGGAATLQLAHDEPRVRAVFNIDGSPIWSAANGALAKPLLVLSAASTNVSYDAVLSGASPGMHLRVAGTAHTFCSDLRLMPFASPGAPSSVRPRPGPAGAIDPVRALTVTSTYVEAFFDQYLNGKTTALLSGPSVAFPEVTFEHVSERDGKT